MAFLARIQFSYNNIIEAIRSNPMVNTSSFLKEFKRDVYNAIKALPEDAKKAIRLKTIRMEQHLVSIINDLRTNNPDDVVDTITWYYHFDPDGELQKIPFNIVSQQTIDVMPKLVRHKRKPDVVKPDRFNRENLIQEEALPEATIQDLYNQFVGQINNDLASLEDIKQYPVILQELYARIRDQIYKKDRTKILKKVKEMITQLEDLAQKKARNQFAEYTISPIHLADKFTGLYPEEKKSFIKRISHKQPQKLMRLPMEDLPMARKEPKDYFEEIPAEDLPMIQQIEEFIQPEPKRRSKKQEFPVEATLRKARRSPRAPREPKDPTDVTKFTVAQLKQFMKERKIKGRTNKKPELLRIVQEYLNQDDEA